MRLVKRHFAEDDEQFAKVQAERGPPLDRLGAVQLLFLLIDTVPDLALDGCCQLSLALTQLTVDKHACSVHITEIVLLFPVRTNPSCGMLTKRSIHLSDAAAASRSAGTAWPRSRRRAIMRPIERHSRRTRRSVSVWRVVNVAGVGLT